MCGRVEKVGLMKFPVVLLSLLLIDITTLFFFFLSFKLYPTWANMKFLLGKW